MKKLTKILIGIVAVIFFSSCLKEETPESYDTTSTQDNNIIEASFDGVYDIVKTNVEEQVDDATAKRSGNMKTSAGDNATVTFDDDSIIVDFGTGVIGDDGRTRKGKIYIEYTGGYRQVGTVLTTTLEDYYVDNIHVEGKKVVTNKGDNTDGDPYFTVEVTNGKLTYPDGKTISNWQSSRVRTWIEGSDTPLNISDDVYEISGTATGTNRKGLDYEIEIPVSNPLVVDINCWFTTRMPKDGVIKVMPDGLQTRSVDYGTGGGCDRKVTVSIGDFSLDLNLNTN